MGKAERAFLLCVGLLFCLGLTMVFDTTAAEAIDRLRVGAVHYALIKQFSYAIVGGIIATGLFYVGYKSLLESSGLLLQVFTVLLVLVLIPGVGQQINGARRWLSIMGHSFQPSEFVKYLIPVYYIHTYIKKGQHDQSLKSFLMIFVKMAIPMGLILIEPDNGTIVIIVGALFVLFIVTRVKWIYFILPLLVLGFIGGAIASRMPHVADRIEIYLHPEKDLKGKGHQPYQAKIAAGSGGLFGRGLGQSLQKFSYLPEARSDYIAAIFAEEFGFCGILFLIGVYMLLGLLGFTMASKASDEGASLTIAIFTFLLCFQAFLNLGIVSGLLPSKGTNLPFFSQGGSSLLANFIAVSIILSASSAKKRPLYPNNF